MKKLFVFFVCLLSIGSPCQNRYENTRVPQPGMQAGRGFSTCSNITGAQRIITIPVNNRHGCSADCWIGEVTSNPDWSCGGSIDSNTSLGPGESGNVKLTCDYKGSESNGCSVSVNYDAEVKCECSQDDAIAAMRETRSGQINQALENGRRANQQEAERRRQQPQDSYPGDSGPGPGGDTGAGQCTCRCQCQMMETRSNGMQSFSHRAYIHSYNSDPVACTRVCEAQNFNELPLRSTQCSAFCF